MVHTFSLYNKNLAFDSENGSLHIFDDVSFSILKLYIENGGNRFPAEVATTGININLDLVNECCDEIDKIISEGFLFSKEQEYRLSDFYPDGPHIKALCLHICHDCNLRCKYCFADSGEYKTGKRSFLTFETGKKAIDFVVDQSGARRNIDIDFFGGEPLMNWDVVVSLTLYCEEISVIKNKNIRLTITTNAVLLDKEKSDFINEHMANCVLSLDGRPEINDKMRPTPSGKGSYSIVSNNITDFVETRGDKSYYVRGTFTRHNTDFAEDVKHIVSLGIKQVSVEPVVGQSETDYNLRIEDLESVYKEYEKLAQFVRSSRKKGEDFEFFHFSIDLESGPCSYKRLKGCGVGSEYIAVTPDGDIYPCHQFTGDKRFLLGNVNDCPVVLDNDVKKRFNNLLVPQKEECNKCWAKYFCSGGCPANAYFSTGNLNGVYEIGCLIQKKRLECALWMKAMDIEEEV